MKRSKIALIVGAAMASLLAAAVAIAQTTTVTAPYVTSMAPTDAGQVIPGGNPAVGSKFGTLLQFQSYFFTLNSQHGNTAPTLTSCGTSPSILGNDWAGTITLGTGSPTGCVATFGTAFVAAPACVVTSQTAPATTTPAYSVSTTAVTIVQAANSSNKYDYVCVAHPGG